MLTWHSASRFLTINITLKIFLQWDLFFSVHCTILCICQHFLGGLTLLPFFLDRHSKPPNQTNYIKKKDKKRLSSKLHKKKDKKRLSSKLHKKKDKKRLNCIILLGCSCKRQCNTKTNKIKKSEIENNFSFLFNPFSYLLIVFVVCTQAYLTSEKNFASVQQ